ncbi:MAG: hypothetical protein GC157_02675 [Frankiales bacterium]|nr:hypothetical protein [Frankiales bacterium]
MSATSPAARPGHAPLDGTSRRLVLAALAFGAVLDVVYWVLWYAARDTVASASTDAYYDFENAFPLADAWLLLCVVAGFVTVLRRSHAALFWLLAGGGAGVYLGCMDTLYDVEHGIWGSGSGGAFELFIVVVTFVFSVSLLRWGWRRRHTLLALEHA